MWLFLMGIAHAQAYEQRPCVSNQDLKKDLSKGIIGSLYKKGPWFYLVDASSVLPPPKGKNPDILAAQKIVRSNPGLVVSNEENPLDVAQDILSCWYGPSNLVDNNEKTAWCEGAEGHGEGEVVLVPYKEGSPLEVRNGFGKSPKEFTDNGRIQKARIHLVGAGWEPPMVNGQSDLPVLGSHEVTLRDTADWQVVATPAWKPRENFNPDRPKIWRLPEQKPSFVAIEIISVYPGKKRQETCLSEVR